MHVHHSTGYAHLMVTIVLPHRKPQKIRFGWWKGRYDSLFPLNDIVRAPYASLESPYLKRGILTTFNNQNIHSYVHTHAHTHFNDASYSERTFQFRWNASADRQSISEMLNNIFPPTHVYNIHHILCVWTKKTYHGGAEERHTNRIMGFSISIHYHTLEWFDRSKFVLLFFPWTFANGHRYFAYLDLCTSTQQKQLRHRNGI